MTRTWWSGWTPTGAVVTCTSALTTLWLVGTACYLAISGNLDAAKEVFAFAGFSGMATNSVAARTRPDPQLGDDPTPVVVQQPDDQPVPVTGADDGPTFPDRA